jgi:class 3 adenylate cyclase
MATVMLVDFENFADLTSSVEPRVLVEQLDQYFSTFDRIVREHSLQMIKTIGDTYICVAGLPEITRDHAIQACGSALAVKRTMDRANAERRKLSLREWRPRIVVHAESMVAGLIGEKRTTFDLWGAGANVARCLIRKCRPGEVTISEAAFGLVAKHCRVEDRGSVDIDKIGSVKVYCLMQLL